MVFVVWVVFYSGSVFGVDGFGYVMGDFGNVKMLQVGYVEIGEDVEIGVNLMVDCVMFDVMRVGKGIKIDNLVQVGYNVQVGENCIFCGQVGVLGSVNIEDWVVFVGQFGVVGYLMIGYDVQVVVKLVVFQLVELKQQVGGILMVLFGKWWWQVSLLNKL